MKESDTKERNLVKRSTNRRFQLCGRQLHQMLTVVCSNRRGKRSVKETEGSIGMYVLLEYLSRETSVTQKILKLTIIYQIYLKISDDLFTSIYRPYSDLDYEPPLTFSNGYAYSNGSPLENFFETSYQVSFRGCS